MKTLHAIFVALLLSTYTYSQTVNISVDVTINRKNVSPYIYGKNNTLSDDPSHPLSANQWKKIEDAGIKLFRENSGNNATKYNWRLKLTSAPDWYNNVYGADWDYEAKSLQQHIPGARGMYAFQLIGKSASNTSHNFNDWAYDESNGGNADSNWAGGGGPKSLGGNGGDGNPNLYLMNWTADSTVGILDKWFGNGAGGLGLDTASFLYWNMDNEPEIWEGTHDDIMPHQISAESLINRYMSVAIKARAKFPNIKLVGFVANSEWFWYAYPDGKGNSGKITYKGKDYTWIEYFIKRVAEKQDSCGVRLLDVVDVHTYFDVSSEADLLQAHRIFFDRTYNYPGANGVKLTSPGGWDESITKEYLFGRINDLLTQYFGVNHGITVGSTEFGWDGFNQMPLALNYASTLGVFAEEGVELFTPWYWSPSYWEVVHLYSRYNKNISVKSTSSDNNNVSAYSTVNSSNDSLTVVLVNRFNTSKNVQVTLSNFSVTDGIYQAYLLNSLPNDNTTETFVNHVSNALKSTIVPVVNNTISTSLPAYSITSIILYKGKPAGNYLGATPSIIDAGNSAGYSEITVYSNTEWNINSNKSWLTLSSGSGSNQGSITASFEENPDTTSREATITLSGTGVETQTITVTQTGKVTYAAGELIIYNDTKTLVKATWNDQGTISEINSGAFEGTKHYNFSFNFTNWWAGFGLNLTNWAGDGSGYNFTKYKSIKFAARLSTADNTAGITLVDADGNTSTDEVSIDITGTGYQEFTIPLSSFTGMDLNDIGELSFSIHGSAASGSGNFQIDDIRLGTVAGSTDNPNGTSISLSESDFEIKLYPNPTTNQINIESKISNPLESVELYNSIGKLMQYKAGEEDKYKVMFDLSDYPSGVYVVKIVSMEGICTKSVIKLNN